MHKNDFDLFESSIRAEIERILCENISFGSIGENEKKAKEEELFSEFVETISSSLFSDLKKSAPAMLKSERKNAKQFQNRNFKRWRSAFDQADMIYRSAEEMGDNFRRAFGSEAMEQNNYKFDALSRIHGKALLVFSEAIQLLRGGFPDGALSRWRTLHELLVVAAVLSRSDNEISLRYIAHFVFEQLRAAKLYNKHAEAANLKPIPSVEIEAIEARKVEFQERFGSCMNSAYGWAHPLFLNQKKGWKATFLDLEEMVGMDHWRPRYKWASQHTHAGSQNVMSLLGESESKELVILVGPSNSGFIDPFQMNALHLADITGLLLMLRPNADTKIQSNVLKMMADEIGYIALNAEKNSLEK